MNKRPEINPDQSKLFILPPQQGDVRTQGVQNWQDAESNPVYGPEGSYVDVHSRSALLVEALGALSARNQRAGFGSAVALPPHDKKIHGNYGRHTDKVVAGAQRNHDLFEEEAKRKFWQASGIPDLQKSGLISKEDAKELGKVFWRDFIGEFGGVKNASNRRRGYQEILKKQQKQIKK